MNLFSLLWKNVLAVLMLAGAMNDIDEEGYYTLLRIVIFLLALWTAYRWHTLGKAVLLWLFVGMAILFNPVIPAHFDKDIWQVIDFVALLAFVVDGYFQVKTYR